VGFFDFVDQVDPLASRLALAAARAIEDAARFLEFRMLRRATESWPKKYSAKRSVVSVLPTPGRRKGSAQDVARFGEPSSLRPKWASNAARTSVALDPSEIQEVKPFSLSQVRAFHGKTPALYRRL